MIYTEKGVIESYIIRELEKLRWNYVSLKIINRRRRSDFEEPLIVEDLRRALRRING